MVYSTVPAWFPARQAALSLVATDGGRPMSGAAAQRGGGGRAGRAGGRLGGSLGPAATW